MYHFKKLFHIFFRRTLLEFEDGIVGGKNILLTHLIAYFIYELRLVFDFYRFTNEKCEKKNLRKRFGDKEVFDGDCYKVKNFIKILENKIFINFINLK